MPKILIVEDDTDIVESLTVLLQEEGYSVCQAFNAKTVDYAKESIVFRLADDSRRIDDFINLMRDYTILEICRTGSVSLEKGSSTIRKVTNL